MNYLRASICVVVGVLGFAIAPEVLAQASTIVSEREPIVVYDDRTWASAARESLEQPPHGGRPGDDILLWQALVLLLGLWLWRTGRDAG